MPSGCLPRHIGAAVSDVACEWAGQFSLNCHPQ